MKSRKRLISAIGLIIVLLLFSGFTIKTATNAKAKFSINVRAIQVAPPTNQNANDIKIALLLDTSGSMSGLIEQAKSQLWRIVNQLAQAKKNNNYADVEIALYEYGNSGLSRNQQYVRKIVDLTKNLDEISKELFALTTQGGDEFCGEVIQRSMDELEWTNDLESLQLIFIAGNESFAQGETSYKLACQNATTKNIIINTIFCGNYDDGISIQWKNGADITEGFYSSISMNQTTTFVKTPYDEQIEALNQRLNDTYLAFGKNKNYYIQNQIEQDKNSKKYGSSNLVERTISKSSHLYDNSNWDLVDAQKKGELIINSIDNKDLPEEMQTLNEKEKIAYIAQKESERNAIQSQIKKLTLQRTTYLTNNTESNAKNGLDQSMLKAIIEQAKRKGFTFDESANLSPQDPPAAINYEDFKTLTNDVESYRASRLVDIATFNKMSKENGTIILDTRSKEAYNQIHLKGAIHLNFSDFTAEKLSNVIRRKTQEF
ncbi:rhodanese-like domain-containing protein [Crocinitomix algicola]|uniref:rhodanese-like domain-containing protein n=1 Tax=Crocinitomix algicola TaxID=1740263 RepID=UPI000831FB51|nr:rhodanese-like domain-containing protein [Crocinitomix algicola]